MVHSIRVQLSNVISGSGFGCFDLSSSWIQFYAAGIEKSYASIVPGLVSSLKHEMRSWVNLSCKEGKTELLCRLWYSSCNCLDKIQMLAKEWHQDILDINEAVNNFFYAALGWLANNEEFWAYFMPLDWTLSLNYISSICQWATVYPSLTDLVRFSLCLRSQA